MEAFILINAVPVAHLGEENSARWLKYLPQALENPQESLISFSLPPQENAYKGKKVDHFLFNLLPDNQDALKEIAQRGEPCHYRNPLALLLKVGEDCAGNIQIIPKNHLEVLERKAGELLLLTEKDIEKNLSALRQHRRLTGIELEGEVRGLFSLGGYQTKFGVRQKDGKYYLPLGSEATTHIFKPPVPHIENQHFNEVFCQTLASLCGLETANTKIQKFGQEGAVISERFDRETLNEQVFRKQCEDFGQILNIHPAMKYQKQGGAGAQRIASFLLSYASEVDFETFIKAFIFNFLILGTDAHARNYSAFILNQKQVKLAPLYDLNSFLLSHPDHLGKVEMSMSIGKEYNPYKITKKHWEKEFEGMGLNPSKYLALIAEMKALLLEKASLAAEHLIGSGLDEKILTSYPKMIKNHLEKLDL